MLHSAFAFHAVADLRRIAAFDPATLSASARRVAEHAGGNGQAILATLRFAPAWLDPAATPEDTYRLLVVLAECLEPLPSCPGFAALEAALPLLGWDALATRDLLRGRPLGPLLAAAGLPHAPLPACLGWLEHRRAALLHARLMALPEQLPEIPAQAQRGWSSHDLSMRYPQGLADARAMLAAVLERHADLFLAVA